MSEATIQITGQPETINEAMKNNDPKAGKNPDFEPTFSEEKMKLNQMSPPEQLGENPVPKKPFRRVPGLW